MHHDINGLTMMSINEKIQQARKDALAHQCRQGRRAARPSGPGPIRRKLGRAMIRLGTRLAKAETQPG